MLVKKEVTSASFFVPFIYIILLDKLLGLEYLAQPLA